MLNSSSDTPILQRNWDDYYEAIANRPPRKTLLFALDAFEQENSATLPRFAVDLGCGEGRDTVELLRRGWQVWAIDGEKTALERLLKRPDIDLNQLKTQQSRFEALNLPSPVTLINASFALPFCPSAEFPDLWQKILEALPSGGRFCGQLFGNRDSWASYANVIGHTKSEIDTLLSPFIIEYFFEEEEDGITPLNEAKHWHIFHLVIRKP